MFSILEEQEHFNYQWYQQNKGVFVCLATKNVEQCGIWKKYKYSKVWN